MYTKLVRFLCNTNFYHHKGIFIDECNTPYHPSSILAGSCQACACLPPRLARWTGSILHVCCFSWPGSGSRGSRPSSQERNIEEFLSEFLHEQFEHQQSSRQGRTDNQRQRRTPKKVGTIVLVRNALLKKKRSFYLRERFLKIYFS